MSEVYEVGRKSFEDMTEMLLNNKNISNDQRRGLREAYVLSKREEYCLIGKSDDEVEEIIRKKSPKDRLSMMKCFKVPYSQRKRRLTVDELIKSFQKEMNDCFPRLRRSLILLIDGLGKEMKRHGKEDLMKLVLLTPCKMLLFGSTFHRMQWVTSIHTTSIVLMDWPMVRR